MRMRGRSLTVVAVIASAVLYGAPARALEPAPTSTTTTTLPAPPPSVLPPAPAVAAAVKGHLLDVTASAKPVSAWAAADLSSLESAASIVGAASVAPDPHGGIVVAGRTPAGHVLVFTSGAKPGSWTELDATTLATAPIAAGTPAVVVDPAGVTRVFFRTTNGDLDEAENDRKATDPWFASDLTTLTAATEGAKIAGNPTVLAAPGYPTAVYARAVGGDLVSYTLTATPGHPWYFVDVSALAEGPPIQGVPAAVPAPDGFGLTAVYCVSANGDLIEFTNDDAGYHLWSVRDVSATLKLGTVSSSPTALAGLPTEVATVTTLGHLVVVSVPTVSLVGATFQDLSSFVRQRVEPSRTASIAAAKSGYVVAAVTPTSHLVTFVVASATATTAKLSDVTMQAKTEQLAGGDPVAADVDGVTNLLVPSGGYLALIPRIVVTAVSQDQHHAKIEDTPHGSDCNPYTASYDRGSTTGCAPGTAAEEWCSDFSEWVWQNAGVDVTGIDAASKTFVTWGRARGQFLQGINAKPAVGDAVVWGVLNPLWGAHVGIVIGVKGKEIDVVAGNSGTISGASAVWDSGYFVPSSMTAQGDPIIGYVSPVPLPANELPVTPSQWPRTGAWPDVQGSGSITG